MLGCAIIIIIIIAAVGLGIWYWKYYDSKPASPISKDGTKINDLNLDDAVKALKENGFKQSDTDIKHMLAISYMYASMKKDDLKEIATSLSKTGNKSKISKDEDGTKEGAKKDDDKEKNEAKAKETVNNGESADKLDSFNKAYLASVFQKDGVSKVLKDDKNTKAKQLLMSMKDVDPKSPAKPKLPNYEKIIKKQNTDVISKDDKNLEPLSQGVFAVFIEMYEKVLTTKCSK